jgi:hypothetical protein
LFAVTENVYEAPFVRPVTVQLRAPAVVQVNPPGDEVTVYRVMGWPPLLAGASHETEAELLKPTALTPVGAPGVVAGVTALETPAELVPMALVAVTRKLYETPLVRPTTVQLVAPVVPQVRPPGIEVTA